MKAFLDSLGYLKWIILLIVAGVALLALSMLRSSVPQSFSIVDTFPSNAETEVNTGEISITFTTDQPIKSEKDFTFSIVPKVPFYYKFENSYPTNIISAKIYGGLKPSTKYTMTVLNDKGKYVHSWYFTTGVVPTESSSSLVQEQEKKFNAEFFPLFDQLPRYTATYDMGYEDKMTLYVTVKNNNMEQVKRDVEAWIRSQGVDPKTHKINYSTQ